jgi:hypothetical protein
MKKTPSNGNYRRKADSQESDIVKERITFESALREEGMDEVFVARKLKELLRAQRQRWNPRKRSWEKFENYGTQLAALSEIAKIFCIHRKDSEGEGEQVLVDIDMSAIPPERLRGLASPSDGSYGSAPNSREPEVDKEGITYESALREEGIDEVFVARKLKELLRAQGQRWNSKEGCWNRFEDYDIRLAALREIAKIRGLYRKDSEDENKGVLIDLGGLTPKSVRERANGESP